MKLHFVLCASRSLRVIAGAQAQTFPSRPVTIIAPTTAGGPPDTIARLLSERMQAVLGQPIVVENVTGAGCTLRRGARRARGARRPHAQHRPPELARVLVADLQHRPTTC